MLRFCPPHVLSGHNPTLFNVVLQYADMDMLRALVLTSHSLHRAIEHCRFNHLTLVVLEAPILEEQQQIVYNGADPVPSSTFRLPLNGAPTTSPSSQTQNSILVDTEAFGAWQQRSAVRNNYDHNLIIPDYARNLMARAQSVALVVYRRRLGTRISAFFTTNAHHLKHGQLFTCVGCPSCPESPSVAAQYKLHLHCAPTPYTPHYNRYDERIHGDVESPTSPSSDSDCVFSKHRSHEYFEGDAAESRRSRFLIPPDNTPYSPRRFPYDDLTPLRLEADEVASFNTTTPERNSDCGNKNQTKHKRHTECIFDRSGEFDINASANNTRVFRPRFQNLPLVAQLAPTTSLNIHIVDCVSFGVEDWCNAIPGCTIRPVQTWIIHDDPSVPYHPYHSLDRTARIYGDGFYEREPLPTTHIDANHNTDNNDDHTHLDRHFPHLTSLVLQYTRLDNVNQCGTSQLGHHRHANFKPPSRLSHFFIDCSVNLPHLHHFGVVGTLLDARQCARIASDNAHTTSLNFNPGPQPTSRHSASPTLQWMYALANALNEFGHHEPPPRPRGESLQQVDTEEDVHKIRPRRKYNFSFDFANSHVDSCCPHKTHILTQRTLPNAWTYPDSVTPPFEDCSHFSQHLLTCGTIHRSLADVYWADRNGLEYYSSLSLSRSPPLELVFPHSEVALSEDTFTFMAIARLTYLTLTHLELRCHYCLHTNPGSTPFPGASPGDCTATHLPPPVGVPLRTNDLLQDDEGVPIRERSTQRDEQMYMRLRQLLHIPPHVVLRL